MWWQKKKPFDCDVFFLVDGAAVGVARGKRVVRCAAAIGPCANTNKYLINVLILFIIVCNSMFKALSSR